MIRTSMLAALALTAGIAAAQAPAPSVPSTGSNAGRAPALAPATGGGSSGAATMQPGIPARSGEPLPPANASGLAPPQAPAPASGRGGLPTRSDSAATAFRALDSSQRGYVTRADTDRVAGFVGFDNADRNRDGQLSPEEFHDAWKFYAGQ
jgi:hypothetical protein